MKNIDQLLGIEITEGNPLKIYHPVHGKLFYYKCSFGYEYWKEYDFSGNLIYRENSDGFEYWMEYDSQGNLVYYKVNDKVFLDNRKKSLTKSEIAEKLGISVEDVENAQ